MGCAPSSDVGVIEFKPDQGQKGIKSKPSYGQDIHSSKVSPLEESNNNSVKKDDSKKSVAFEIGFESNIDSLINKHPPKRLKNMLAPLPESAPKLTAEQLQERIKQAEENRQKELEKKKNVSRRSNRLRQEVMRAREQEREQGKEAIDDKLQTAELARQKRQEEMAEKKRQREERARKARERAKKLKSLEGEDLDYEIEKDEAFNQEDGDSWLDGDNNTSDYHTDNDRFTSGEGHFRGDKNSTRGGQKITSGDHVYNGRTSPAKTPREGNKESRVVSAVSSSTGDSFDYAYQRAPAAQRQTNTSVYDRTQETDDFFDS